MPNLENLKKQAKQYLPWHRERYYPVAAEIRAALPRFQDLNDNQVLEASFKFSDAQELMARKAGFQGWQALLCSCVISFLRIGDMLEALPFPDVSRGPVYRSLRADRSGFDFSTGRSRYGEQD